MTNAVTTYSGPSGPLATGGAERQPPTGCTHEETRRYKQTDARGLPVFVVVCVDCGSPLERIGGGR